MKKKLLVISTSISFISIIISGIVFMKLLYSGINFADTPSVENAKIVIFSNLWGFIVGGISISIIFTIITLVTILKSKVE